MMRYPGNYFRGRVEIAVSGAPEAMRYSHCRPCRLGGSHAVIVE
jgi:hypothetical protein